MSPNPPATASVLRSFARFIQDNCWRLIFVSAAVLLPCFWHRHIAAGDLGSHLYNAWLVELIHQGRAPDLWVSHQWNNVMFDLMLDRLGRVFGLSAAEKIAVAASVLIFFWGAFALVCAATRRTPWFLLPALAMIAYGWTFQSGFSNYYLGIGLSFWGLAIFWQAKGWEKLLAIPLVPLTLMAHPLGLGWLVGAAGYIVLTEIVPRRKHAFLVLGAAVVLVGVHFYVRHHYQVRWAIYPVYLINGADQLVLGVRYYFPAVAALLLGLICLISDTSRRDRTFWIRNGVPLQLYAITLLCVWLLPTLIHLPQYAGPLAFLRERISLISAILACCVIGTIQPRRWHAAGFAAIAAVFFSFAYQDTATLSRMETRVEELLSTVPAGARVLDTIHFDKVRSRLWFNNSMVARACIGHCFCYGNYEAATGQFRIRASPGNRLIMASSNDITAMEEGSYVVRADDLPAYQIYQGSANWTDLDIRPLAVGEKNNRLGIHPPLSSVKMDSK